MECVFVHVHRQYSHFRTVEVFDVCMVDVYIACVAKFAHGMFAGFVHWFGQIQLYRMYSQYQLKIHQVLYIAFSEYIYSHCSCINSLWQD